MPLVSHFINYTICFTRLLLAQDPLVAEVARHDHRLLLLENAQIAGGSPGHDPRNDGRLQVANWAKQAIAGGGHITISGGPVSGPGIRSSVPSGHSGQASSSVPTGYGIEMDESLHERLRNAETMVEELRQEMREKEAAEHKARCAQRDAEALAHDAERDMERERENAERASCRATALEEDLKHARSEGEKWRMEATEKGGDLTITEKEVERWKGLQNEAEDRAQKMVIEVQTLTLCLENPSRYSGPENGLEHGEFSLGRAWDPDPTY